MVRILTLPERFFASFTNSLSVSNDDHSTIDGLDEALERAQQHVDQFGVPICDFKTYRRTEMEQRPKIRFKNAVRRAQVLYTMNKQSTSSMMTNLMEQLKVMVVQEEEKQVKKSKFELV